MYDENDVKDYDYDDCGFVGGNDNNDDDDVDDDGL